MNLDIFRYYLELKNKKALIEAELDDIKTNMEALSVRINDELVDNGIDNIKLDGYTIYPKLQLYASAQLTPENKPLFVEHGLGDMIKETINGNSMSAYVREFMKDSQMTIDQLPEWLRDNVSMTEKITIGVRRS
jgi:hypothetical protein